MLNRMFQRVRAHVPALLVLFVALGGTAVAATRALPANSVGTKQLQNGAVTGQKVASHTLTGANINLSKLGTVPNSAKLAGFPASAFLRGVSAGTGLSASRTSGHVSLAIAHGYQLPQSCATDELVQWTGSGWGCASNPSGTAWQLTGNAGTSPANDYVGTSDHEPLNLDVNGSPALQLAPDPTSPILIGGWQGNSVAAGASGSVIGGGGANDATNKVTGSFGVVGGGLDNSAGGPGNSPGVYATVAGGVGNTASGNYSFAAGENNTATGADATALGDNNTASGPSSIAIGLGNTASLEGATALGNANDAGGEDSVVLGQNATDNNNFNSFVWSDGTQSSSSSLDFAATGPKVFDALATNGFTFQLSAPLATFDGCRLTSGSAGWSCTSDRNAKHDFQPISDQSILGALGRMPIESWSYKLDRSDTRHIGPTAQAFIKAFRVGNNPKAIGTLDEGGVALAGIKGLYGLVQRQQQQIRQLEGQVSALERSRHSGS